MKGKAARKKPKEPPRGSPPQPGEGSVLTKSLYVYQTGFRDALQQVREALLQEARIKALREGKRKRKPKPRQPRVDKAALFDEVMGLCQLAGRDPDVDRDVIRDVIREIARERIMARDDDITIVDANKLLKGPSWAQRWLNTLVKYVQRERRRRSRR